MTNTMTNNRNHTFKRNNDLTSLQDQPLLAGLIRGEEIAFERIYAKYFLSLRNYSASIVGDFEVASDIVQNIFVLLWEKRRRLNPDKSIRNYLLCSTHNNSLRHLKTKSLHKRHQKNIKLEQKTEELNNVIADKEHIEPEQKIRLLLDKLPNRSKQVTIMSYLEKKKSADIARELGISVRTVETILYKSMKKLREKVKK